MKKLLAMLLAALMLFSVIGAVAEETAEQGTPLVVATSDLSGKFSPFFADTAYDQDVVDLTQANMNGFNEAMKQFPQYKILEFVAEGTDLAGACRRACEEASLSTLQPGAS